MKLDKLGWFAAVAMAGTMFGMGFQASAPKFATVDMPKVFEEADLTKSGNTELKDFFQTRVNVLQFLNQNPPMLPTDAAKYAELTLKTPQTPSDQTELKRITADAQTATVKQRELVQKPGLSADEQRQIADFSSRVQQNQELTKSLQQQYDHDLETTRLRLHDQAMDKVRQTVQDLAKKQGYTVVFSIESAPYAANDLTSEAEKAVANKTK